MNYIVNIPNGKEITLGLPYGSATYTIGQIVPESYVTKSFPQYFTPLPEPQVQIKVQPTAPTAPIDDIIQKIKDNILKETESKNETPKKAGRPAKAGFSKGK